MLRPNDRMGPTLWPHTPRGSSPLGSGSLRPLAAMIRRSLSLLQVFSVLVVRIQTKQRKSTFGNELELWGGSSAYKRDFLLSLRGDAGTKTTRGKVGGPKQNFRVREGYEEGPGTGVGGDLGLGDLKNRQSCLHAREWSQNDRPRTHQNLSDFMF